MSRAHQSSRTKNDAYAAGPYAVSLPCTCTVTAMAVTGALPARVPPAMIFFRTRGSHIGPFFIAGFLSRPSTNQTINQHNTTSSGTRNLKSGNQSTNSALPTPHSKLMKLLTSLLAASTLALAASAQTNTVPATNAPIGSPTPPANFFATVQSYLTSIDTNYTWISNRVEIAVGADYLAGIDWANYASAQYDLGHWDLETKVRNLGAAGVIESFEGGAGYTFLSNGSVKLQGSVLLGYDLNRSAAMLEPQAVIKKKATTNTYLELGLGLPLWLQKPVNNRPNLFIGAGFTF